MTNKKIPMRQCIGCGEMKAKKEMTRVIKTTEGAITLDTTGRMNGRGAYICPDPQCLQKARKAKSLERSLETEVPEQVYDRLQKELEGYTLG
jgi:predicted RNA-binding protein YlxR (DUF448 family)